MRCAYSDMRQGNQVSQKTRNKELATKQPALLFQKDLRVRNFLKKMSFADHVVAFIFVGMKNIFPFALLLFSFFCMTACATDPPAQQDELNVQIKLPKGFKISLFAENVKNARAMALGANGTIFVGSRSEGNVYALRDTNGDFKSDKMWVLESDVPSPAGVAFHNGDLYYSAVSKIFVLRDIEANLDNPPQPQLVTDRYPTEESHGWKFIGIGPDDKLYIPVGAPCNICKSEDSVFASITRMNLDGSGYEIFAHGIRNTVGFDWHPVTKELWFTENGRDWLGDNLPPDELNVAPQSGMHFGYPFCHGGYLKDTEFGDERACSEFTAPVQNLGPHVAALGMRFYTGNMFPAEYRNQVFIAEHGSWNRSTKIGYRVMLVKLQGNKSLGYEEFATGWEQDGKVIGRPVDVLVLEDGSMLVSDDYAHKIYRITYAD